jgi:hypothetical protein
MMYDRVYLHCLGPHVASTVEFREDIQPYISQLGEAGLGLV